MRKSSSFKLVTYFPEESVTVTVTCSKPGCVRSLSDGTSSEVSGWPLGAAIDGSATGWRCGIDRMLTEGASCCVAKSEEAIAVAITAIDTHAIKSGRRCFLIALQPAQRELSGPSSAQCKGVIKCSIEKSI